METDERLQCCGTCKEFKGEILNGDTFNEMAIGFCYHWESTKACDGWCRFWSAEESEGKG
jgi:hypothetical protein